MLSFVKIILYYNESSKESGGSAITPPPHTVPFQTLLISTCIYEYLWLKHLKYSFGSAFSYDLS